MLAAILAFLGALIPAGIKAWFAARASPLQNEAEKAGAAEQAEVDTQAQAQASAAEVKAAVQAPNTADEVADRMEAGTF
jgi:hypothetical protein